MSPVTRALALAGALVAGILLLGAGATDAAAQAPTLPSDTLEANFVPPSEMAPNPELAPSLPSDTIKIGAPLEGYDSTVTDSLNPPPAADDSAAVEPRPQY